MLMLTMLKQQLSDVMNEEEFSQVLKKLYQLIYTTEYDFNAMILQDRAEIINLVKNLEMDILDKYLKSYNESKEYYTFFENEPDVTGSVVYQEGKSALSTLVLRFEQRIQQSLTTDALRLHIKKAEDIEDQTSAILSQKRRRPSLLATYHTEQKKFKKEKETEEFIEVDDAPEPISLMEKIMANQALESNKTDVAIANFLFHELKESPNLNQFFAHTNVQNYMQNNLFVAGALIVLAIDKRNAEIIIKGYEQGTFNFGHDDICCTVEVIKPNSRGSRLTRTQSKSSENISLQAVTLFTKLKELTQGHATFINYLQEAQKGAGLERKAALNSFAHKMQEAVVRHNRVEFRPTPPKVEQASKKN